MSGQLVIGWAGIRQVWTVAAERLTVRCYASERVAWPDATPLLTERLLWEWEYPARDGIAPFDLAGEAQWYAERARERLGSDLAAG